PEAWRGQQVLLHFEAVDWEATVWVNGQRVGSHQGGYDPFSLDITEALKPEGDQELVVRVWDPTDRGFQPRGKQVQNPHGIWYTAVSGIWQSVWLEPVGAQHITSVAMTPDVDQSTMRIEVETSRPLDGMRLRTTVSRVGRGAEGVAPRYRVTDAGQSGKTLVNVVHLAEPRLWSPAEPWLYDVELE